jgi:hypothetical protein
MYWYATYIYPMVSGKRGQTPYKKNQNVTMVRQQMADSSRQIFVFRRKFFFFGKKYWLVQKIHKFCSQNHKNNTLHITVNRKKKYVAFPLLYFLFINHLRSFMCVVSLPKKRKTKYIFVSPNLNPLYAIYIKVICLTPDTNAIRYLALKQLSTKSFFFIYHFVIKFTRIIFIRMFQDQKVHFFKHFILQASIYFNESYTN